MTRKESTIAGLKEALAYKEGKDVGVSATNIVPSDIDVKSIRESLHLSQEEFAKRYGLTLSALRNWEQGRRKPEGPARVLLKLIERDPKAIYKILREQHA